MVPSIVLRFALLVVLGTAGHVSGRCSINEIHEATSSCLTSFLVDPMTDPLVPVLNDSDAVVNFCLRHINDIKTCYMNVISACTSDIRVKILFGSTGAALLSAFDGICSEPQKDEDMTCAHGDITKTLISQAVQIFIKSVDNVDMQNTSFDAFCTPMQELHDDVMAIMHDAVKQGECSNRSSSIMHQYLNTVAFPCRDIATVYYPCTLERLNNDAMECYANNGVIVRNALIPTPGSLSNADEMCSSKSSILACIKGLITKCLYEPQVATLYGSAVEGVEAAFECMCAPENFDMILSCPATADVTTPMTTFTSSVHSHTIAGTLTRTIQCSLERTLITSIESAMASTCTNPYTKSHWRAYLSTIIYPCTKIDTQCYPRNHYSGADSKDSLPAMLASITALLLVQLVL